MMNRRRRLHLMPDGNWHEEAPRTCANGHVLQARSVLVGARACGCGIGHHRTHHCRTCGDTVFSPPLGETCTDGTFDGRAGRATRADRTPGLAAGEE
ncbi:hypothetical protein ACWEQ4_02565 [Rhodococcus sp. NPDC003994]